MNQQEIKAYEAEQREFFIRRFYRALEMSSNSSFEMEDGRLIAGMMESEDEKIILEGPGFYSAIAENAELEEIDAWIAEIEDNMLRKQINDQQIIGEDRIFQGSILPMREKEGLFIDNKLPHPCYAHQLADGRWIIEEWLPKSLMNGLIALPALKDGKPEEIEQAERARQIWLDQLLGGFKLAYQDYESSDDCKSFDAIAWIGLSEAELIENFFKDEASHWMRFAKKQAEQAKGEK